VLEEFAGLLDRLQSIAFGADIIFYDRRVTIDLPFCGVFAETVLLPLIHGKHFIGCRRLNHLSMADRLG
jgi:hypothetical protein